MVPLKLQRDHVGPGLQKRWVLQFLTDGMQQSELMRSCCVQPRTMYGFEKHAGTIEVMITSSKKHTTLLH